MVVEPKVMGRVYLHTPHDDEDLRFIERGSVSSTTPRLK